MEELRHKVLLELPVLQVCLQMVLLHNLERQKLQRKVNT